MLTERSGQYGDTKDFDVTIDGRSIMTPLLSTTIYQEIQSPFWTIIIKMRDFNNNIILLPIRPGAAIVVSIKTDTPTATDGMKTFNFTLTGIPKREMKNHQHIEYTITGISTTMIKNINTRICRCYRGKPTNIVAKTFIEEYIGGTVDTSPESEAIVNGIVPTMSPFTLGMQMTRASYSSKTADYLFFQRDENLWEIKRMEDMYNDGPLLTIRVRPQQVRGDDGNLVEDFGTMLSSYFVMHYDVLSSMLAGLYASKVVQFDWVTKEWSSKTFKYGDDCPADGEKKSWKNEALETPANNIFFYPTDEKAWDGKHIHDYAKKWGPSRKSSLQKLQQDRIYLQLPGGIDAWKYLGKRIDVELPSEQDWCDELFYDPQLSGQYLVTAVVHDVGKGTHSTKAELVKKRHEIPMDAPCPGYDGGATNNNG